MGRVLVSGAAREAVFERLDDMSYDELRVELLGLVSVET